MYRKMRDYYSHLRTKTLSEAAAAIERSYSPKKLTLNAKKRGARQSAAGYENYTIEYAESGEIDFFAVVPVRE